MRKYNLLCHTTFCIFAVLILANLASAQYWLQSGVRGSNDAAFNNGAGVLIQTVYQNSTNGSLGFWVGESLSNGAFIQVGYEITNATGYYSSSCVNSTKDVFVRAGVPTWFWEYFTSGNNNDAFCGGIGPNGSAGANGTFNNYSFRSVGDTWYAYFNGDPIGSVNLGTSNSGPNPPSAFAEYADTNSDKWPLSDIKFKNLFSYMGNITRLSPEGYSVISYGKGSETALPNDYGVEEFGNFANYFVIGSGIPTSGSSSLLWRIGYNLVIYSQYGNLTGGGDYIAYSTAQLNAPSVVNVSSGVREVFAGWSGRGSGSYTGNNTAPSVFMDANITETAMWKRQYYLNASTQYGAVSGAGWYYANTTATVGLSQGIVTIGSGSRVVFSQWSNNVSINKTVVFLSGPESIHPIWTTQYYVDATTPYGNTTGVGWYDSGSSANISITKSIIPINGTERLAFEQWSNGELESSIHLFVNSPITISAQFEREYLVRFLPENSDGQQLSNVSYYNVSSRLFNSTAFLFSNKTYSIEYMRYKGVDVAVNHHFRVMAPTNLTFSAPVYNVTVVTQSVFGTPVNASVNVTFKNKTVLNTYTGGNGTLVFHNVPLGYVFGYAEYFGIRQSINLGNGTGINLTFVDQSLVAFIVGGILLIVAVARITVYYDRKKHSK